VKQTPLLTFQFLLRYLRNLDAIRASPSRESNPPYIKIGDLLTTPAYGRIRKLDFRMTNLWRLESVSVRGSYIERSFRKRSANRGQVFQQSCPAKRTYSGSRYRVDDRFEFKVGRQAARNSRERYVSTLIRKYRNTGTRYLDFCCRARGIGTNNTISYGETFPETFLREYRVTQEESRL
jgi:hypothetical protein